MSKKKKLSHAQKLQIRQQRSLDVPQTGSPTPSPQAVEAYARVFQWAQEMPQQAAALSALSADEIEHNVIGIAYADELQLPQYEIELVADNIKTWHILNGYMYFYDWWNVPVAEMSVADIIAQVKKDHAAGRVPPLIREAATDE